MNGARGANGAAGANGATGAVVPVVVIGGYLGSGKTTLVNHVLRTGTGRRTMVLVNDFGALAIDDELVVSADGGVVALANGCVCCGLTAPLIETLVALRDEGPGAGAPELLIVEASGVADPARVAAHARIPGYALDGVVVVADAETVRRRSADPLVGPTVSRQLAAADLVVCNKTDLVDTATRTSVRAWLGERAPGARVVEAVHGAVPVSFVVDPGVPPPVSHDLRTGATSVGHGHEVWEWSSRVPLDRARVEALVAALPEGVVRAKGVLALRDEPDRRTVFQLVGRRWELTRGAPWGNDPPSSRLVVIGATGSVGDGFASALE